MSDQDHFTLHAAGQPTARGRFVRTADLEPISFAPGLDFRPVLGDRMLANFAYYEPHAVAPLHVHEEEQIVIVISGALEFEIDGETRTLHPGDAAVVPPWVPHGAHTTGGPCLEVDVFSPPRRTLLEHAMDQAEGRPPAPG
jgi:quercetin dioxygenase-like cupin family protein